MNFSPALDEKYLLENFSTKVQSYELTEVVRQMDNSGILHNATYLRKAIKNNSFGQIDINTNFNDIVPVENGSLLENYLNASNNKIDDKLIIIAYSNATVKSYNTLIRAHFFPNQPFISNEDRVIVLSNNYNYQIELLNGDFGTVKEINKQTETRITTLNQKDKEGNGIEIKVPMTFRKTIIEFHDAENKPHLIDCFVIENLLYSEQRDLTSDEMKALYVDFWIRNPKIDKIRRLLQANAINNDEIKAAISNIGIGDISDSLLDKVKRLQKKYFEGPNSKFIVETSLYILKETLKQDKYFNALRLKFGYAITCHKRFTSSLLRSVLSLKSIFCFYFLKDSLFENKSFVRVCLLLSL